MPRPQFTLRALLVAMLVVAAFFGGMAVQKQFDKPTLLSRDEGLTHFKEKGFRPHWRETIRLPDGTKWERRVFDKPQE